MALPPGGSKVHAEPPGSTSWSDGARRPTMGWRGTDSAARGEKGSVQHLQRQREEGISATHPEERAVGFCPEFVTVMGGGLTPT